MTKVSLNGHIPCKLIEEEHHEEEDRLLGEV
jgi:hypothetical protein